MHKGKVLSISFPVKSSKELASRLGVSKSRTDRISAIIEKVVEPQTMHSRAKKSHAGHVIPTSRGRNPRTEQRSNARKTAKAAR